MELEKLNVYKLAMELGEKVWALTENWDSYKKKILGSQLIRAVDSIAANISEGYGRYHFKENKNFVYYARGSLFEVKTWLIKANNRKLISQDNFNALLNDIDILGVKLNNYITL